MLGGGHGWLQGQYGLGADQIVSARLVLSNGDAVVVSETSNPDLFWAVRGAGHNFGIVTEMQYRIYDVQNPQWSFQAFFFSGDKLEALYELTNQMMKTQPPEVSHYAYIVRIPDFDPDHVSLNSNATMAGRGQILTPTKPIIWYFFVYDGPATTARAYAEPIEALGPLHVDRHEAPMPDMAQATLMAEESVACASGSTGLRFPVGLKSYNVSAVRNVYDEIDRTVRDIPEFVGTFFLLEGYSTQAVKAIDERSTAFPHRSDEILITSYILYAPNKTLDAMAVAFGERLRQLLLDGSDDPEHLRAYVNYAIGDESVAAMYGWDEWRLTKLRALKKKWDPENRMRHYNPLA
jgi:FAD/FMN-containing dehydrogenase